MKVVTGLSNLCCSAIDSSEKLILQPAHRKGETSSTTQDRDFVGGVKKQGEHGLW